MRTLLLIADTRRAPSYQFLTVVGSDACPYSAEQTDFLGCSQLFTSAASLRGGETLAP